MDALIVWILVYFVLASQFYILDKKGKLFLRKFYLFLYNLGHRDEITEAEVTRGFVYNQNVRTRLTGAVVFDIFLSVLFWNVNSLDTGVNILLMFIGTPVIFLGFWFGGVLLDLVSRLFTKTVNTIDDIETGKLDPLEELQRSVNGVKEKIDNEIGKENEEVVDTEPVKTTSSRREEDEEALAALRSFQKGK